MQNNPLFLNFGALIFSSIETINAYLQFLVLVLSIGWTVYQYIKSKKNGNF